MKLDNKQYITYKIERDCVDTLYSQNKEHCIMETCHIYNKGDQGGATRSANC